MCAYFLIESVKLFREAFLASVNSRPLKWAGSWAQRNTSVRVLVDKYVGLPRKKAHDNFDYSKSYILSMQRSSGSCRFDSANSVGFLKGTSHVWYMKAFKLPQIRVLVGSKTYVPMNQCAKR